MEVANLRGFPFGLNQCLYKGLKVLSEAPLSGLQWIGLTYRKKILIFSLVTGILKNDDFRQLKIQLTYYFNRNEAS
jgi:hypothetical protein